LRDLQANVCLRAEIRAAIENGLPAYAECSGLMYLACSITWGKQRGEMVGALLCDVVVTGKPQGHGLRRTGSCWRKSILLHDKDLREAMA
jgi:cobyrinic acid a,c-diamide synthase